MTSNHRRSKSSPGNKLFDGASVMSDRVKLDVGYNTETEKKKKREKSMSSTHDCAHKTLKQEIIQLEKSLQEQLNVRRALEEVLGVRRSSAGFILHGSMPKTIAELIKEIAVLEVEVMLLEQYLLSIYRKAFDSKLSFGMPSSIDKIQDSETHAHRCRSAIVEWSLQNLTTAESLDDSAHGCCYPPLPTQEDPKNSATNVISLAEHLGARISDLIPETPNRISEDMVKCICAIYTKLSSAPLPSDALSSPCSSSWRSTQAFSPRDRLDSWSPGIGNSSSFDVCLESRFNVKGLGEFSGPYGTMVEVTFLYQESIKSDQVNQLLENYRSLIARLEKVDPRNLNHEEKLAFWINIHNALVMHAFLAYGIPRNNGKRVLLLLKAAYNVGGHTISAATIQSPILGCRMSRPWQWLRLLLSSRTKFKAGDGRRAYAIDRPEPLLHFALSCGSQSDPAVRLYTPGGIFLEMEAAKEDYILMTFGVGKDHKLFLPKLVESFAKDSRLSTAGVMEVVHLSISHSSKKMLERCRNENYRKDIEWVPHKFSFRYLIVKELVK